MLTVRPPLHTVLPLLFASLSGVMLALAMPGYGITVLAWGGIAPLLWAIHRVTGRAAFALGWIAGIAYHMIGMYWVAYTIHTYGGLPMVVGYLVTLLLAVYLGVYVGLFAWLARLLAARRIPYLLSTPFLWAGLEYLRAHLLTGLPWNLLGLAFYQNVRLVQVADLTGIYGLSAAVVMVNAALFQMLRPLLAKDRAWTPLHLFNHAVVLLLIPITVVTYGQISIAALSLQAPADGARFRVALVQPDIPQRVKWDPAYREAILARLERMTREAAAGHPDLIVWPEASMPVLLEQSAEDRERLATLARESATYLIVGSPTLVPQGRDVALENSAYLLGPDGAILGRDAKRHLVPFGEYVPLDVVLGFINKMVEGIGTFVPGGGPPLAHPTMGKLGFAICYEMIFPDLVRERFMDGAQLLVTITNDAWFGKTVAPEQHFANAVFRAVENRSYVIRAANTGISGMVDPFGRIRAQSEMDTETVLDVTVEKRLDAPFYSRHGDLFAVSSVLFTALLFGYAHLAPLRRPGTKS